MKKKGAIRVITSEINITNGKSVGSILMKRIVSLNILPTENLLVKKNLAGIQFFKYRRTIRQ